MHLFYTPGIDINAQTYVLSEEESRHSIKVLRLLRGDHISLIDGKGNLVHAVITDALPKKTEVKLLNIEKEVGARNHYLQIAIAPTKIIDRFEWFLEKATEIGIDEITPIICERSERKDLKLERLEKVIVSAMKQSLTAYLPKLNKPLHFKQFIAQNRYQNSYIAHCMDGKKAGLGDLLKKREAATVLIGPEGDFSPEELSLATDKGMKAIHLGSTRLRTETAALYACFEVNLLNRE